MPAAAPLPASRRFIEGVGDVELHRDPLAGGRLRYRVRGPRLRGTFLVSPELSYGERQSARVRVVFGDGPADWPRATARPDEPVINGLTLHGWTGSIDLAVLPHVDWVGVYSHARARRPGGVGRRTPDKTADRLRALVHALVGDFVAHPKRDEVLLEAAARHARELTAEGDRELARIRGQLAEARDEQAQVRHLIRQLSALQRRRPAPRALLAADPVALEIVSPAGQRIGAIQVREEEVLSHGRVVYQVDGARVHGLFTAGPSRYDPSLVPQGLEIRYGRTPDGLGVPVGEPTVNGVLLSGGWSHPRDVDGITLTSPSRLPAAVRLGPTTSMSAPTATSWRASAVLRALAVHFLARPDLAHLRLAAGQLRAPGLLADARRRGARLREQVRHLERQLRHHQALAATYSAWAGLVPQHLVEGAAVSIRQATTGEVTHLKAASADPQGYLPAAVTARACTKIRLAGFVYAEDTDGFRLPDGVEPTGWCATGSRRWGGVPS